MIYIYIFWWIETL